MNRIKRVIGRFRGDRRGLLTFEWILLISLLVIGVIGGLGAVRNALICELVDLSKCIKSIDSCKSHQCEPCVCDITDPNCCMNNNGMNNNGVPHN